MSSKNEGKVLHVAVKLLETLHGRTAKPNGENPDRGGTRPGVDWRMQIGTTMYWLEHTLVQPFECERRGGETVDKVANHLKRNTTTLDGPGCYEITLAQDAQIANGPKGDQQLETLDQWIRETATRWPPLGAGSKWENPDGLDREETGQPENWTSMVTLQRYNAAYTIGQNRTPGSVVLRGRRAPEDPETAQRLTVQRAFDRKTKKLEKAAKSEGRTVLVFEAEHVAFDSLKTIGTVLRELPRETSERVDTIILVRTEIDPWHATFLKHGDWIRPAGAPPTGYTITPHGAERYGEGNATINIEDIIEFRTSELTDLIAYGNPDAQDD